ncbi:hypothetical protein LHYA1_G007940 [Lachnellula hyalina]|uniref:Uncharacterized protein n=1 Tax=Lachnellula hyalina TaxID=1316788 RepID=A0A8H8TUW5_9HELO|nr:uncharacterized protein LHYA1_G007940 [Lachnellula hyalina]TVY23259.1 hypothetical protein LHYA1_G007940 [Lachnellula hyalina]
MYWRSTYILTGVLATLNLIIPSAGASSSEGYPFTNVLSRTSAYITDNDDFVTTASVETTQGWKDFSRSLLQINRDVNENREYTKPEVDTLLTVVLSSIQQATETKLNRKVEILGITYPAYIVDYGYLRNLLDIAIEILPGMNDGTQVWPYLHSIRQAYGLNTAEALGYPAGTDIDDEENLLLHFDYQNSVLKASITAITERTTNIERHFRIVDFGGPKQVASPKRLEYLSLRTKALINEELSIPSSAPVQLTDFKRIIFSGDAPASEFKKVREAIIKAVPEFSDRFLDDIKPGWVGAVGAARRAREYRLNPPVIDIAEQIYDSDGWHDEL